VVIVYDIVHVVVTVRGVVACVFVVVAVNVDVIVVKCVVSDYCFVLFYV